MSVMGGRVVQADAKNGSKVTISHNWRAADMTAPRIYTRRRICAGALFTRRAQHVFNRRAICQVGEVS